PVTLLPRDGEERFVSEISPETQTRIDEEVRQLVDDAHRDVAALLTEHRSQLDSLAAALLKAETLDAPAAYAAALVPRRAPVSLEDPVPSNCPRPLACLPYQALQEVE